MRIDIHLFQELYDLAMKHGITQTNWAERSGMSQRRVAELIAMSRGKDLARQFTVEKYVALVGGMMACIGEDRFRDEWVRLIKEENNTDYKLIKQTVFVTLLGDEEIKKRLTSVLELFVTRTRR